MTKNQSQKYPFPTESQYLKQSSVNVSTWTRVQSTNTLCKSAFFFLEKAINKVGINHGRDLGMLRRKERRMAECRRIFPSHQEVEKKNGEKGSKKLSFCFLVAYFRLFFFFLITAVTSIPSLRLSLPLPLLFTSLLLPPSPPPLGSDKCHRIVLSDMGDKNGVW